MTMERKPKNIVNNALAVSLVLGSFVTTSCYFIARFTIYSGVHSGIEFSILSNYPKHSKEYINDSG